MTVKRITINANRAVYPRDATVVGMVAEGMTDAEILGAYPDLEADDLREALAYAAEAVREREPLLTP